MKRKIKINIIEETPTERIVTIAKDLGNLSTADFIKEQSKFINTDIKQLENAVEFVIRDLLADYGLFPNDKDENSLKSVFYTLNKAFKKDIKVIDAYKHTEEKIISRTGDKTIVIDRYNVIQSALRVILVDY